MLTLFNVKVYKSLNGFTRKSSPCTALNKGGLVYTDKTMSHIRASINVKSTINSAYV